MLSGSDDVCLTMSYPALFLYITEKHYLFLYHRDSLFSPAVFANEVVMWRCVVMLRERESVPGATTKKEGTDANRFFTPRLGGQSKFTVCASANWYQRLRCHFIGGWKNSGLKAQMSGDPVKTAAPLRIRLSLILWLVNMMVILWKWRVLSAAVLLETSMTFISVVQSVVIDCTKCPLASSFIPPRCW